MFFKLYENMNIGFKLLSNADLGTASGGTTAIGLYENTLNFIDNYLQYSFAQLIYEDNSKEFLSFLDPIKNKDGSSRSPKIRSGNTKELMIGDIKVNSIVREIRDIAKTDLSKRWYLMWFGLENKDLVFFLIKENSVEYNNLKDIIGEIPNRAIFKNEILNKIVNYLNIKVNNANATYLEELQIAIQACNTDKIHRINPKEIDLHKAQKILRDIGEKGENLVNEYLNKLYSSKKIINYKWMNKNRESGLPYDFEIINNSGDLYYSDAKSTSYNFEKNMFFSSNELKFINENKNYLIHRVYNISNNPALKISNNISNITDDFISHYNNCQTNILNIGIKLNSVKIEVPPNLKALNFRDEPNFIT